MSNEANQSEEKVFREEEKSSTGLNENLAGALCYLAGFVTGIIFLLIEKESKFVRYHAFQSIFVWIGMFILSFGVGLIPIIGWLLSLLIAPVGFILWIYCMFSAYKMKWFKLPFVGNLAEEQISNS
ncbi:DUF4870 domain-containing protein [Aquisalibacillus elongatus]|uniref:Putative membrane protein n=1 Tax=Aquisalibacillus elongatus TaxID=485577 RepID=A0A3N5C704_9BACI|nr:DUF4870 domain-containing protein [Aquisalibacillus elongatus]RPF52221.1 putative membrane protein [Aquisalibacillus elongatus]